MNGFYYALDIIKNQLELDNDVNVVNTGIIEDVLLKKKDIYPYSHILVNNATLNGSTWSVSYSVICMDIVDISKEQTTDIFRGQNNVQDVLNTQFVVINRVLEVLRRGENTHLYQLDGSPNCEPFEDRFEHGVAGWTVTFDLLIPNDMTVCATDVAPVKLCPDFEYTITDADSNILYTGDILSGNSLVQLISNATVTNSLATVLGTILAQGTLELADVDNIDSDGLTVPTPAGVAFTCTPVAPCVDATAVLKDTSGTTISTTPIASGAIANIVASDADYNVEYLNGTPIDNGSIVSGGSKLIQVANPIVCDDATVTLNSVTMDTIPSGTTENIQVLQSTGATEVGSKQGVHWRIADSDISLNGGAMLSVKSEDSQDIELVDQDDTTITPISIIGSTIKVNIPVASTPVGATLMKSGQTTSYRTGDDGELQEGRATDFFTLAELSPFSNYDRFTDELGGATYTNNIVIDWSTYDGATVLGYYVGDVTRRTWNDFVDWGASLSVGTYTSLWSGINVKQFLNLFNYGTTRACNYAPFNTVGINIGISARYLWTNTTYPISTTNGIRFDLAQWALQPQNKANSNNCVATRTFTVTGTTLT
tara:strand:- start:662 stop:2449 length:1788 start_codon:yes stop_codon:yes gene_type:complete